MQDTNGDGRKDTITAVHEEVLGAARAEVVPANYANTSWRNVVASAAGPACAAVFTNPMDVAKTRMQLSGELTKRGEPRYARHTAVHAAPVSIAIAPARQGSHSHPHARLRSHAATLPLTRPSASLSAVC